MVDACDSQFNAAISCFGGRCKVLMCWFHLMKSVKKYRQENKAIIPDEHYDSVLDDIRRLHFSRALEFQKLKEDTLSAWVEKGLQQFVDYFSRQWLEGRFKNWQIFHTPAGFASTDNPLESFNARLKQSFTNREQMRVATFIKVVLENVVPFYSTNHRTFFFYRQPDTKCRAIAGQMKVENFKRVTDSIVNYTGLKTTSQINFELNTCTCKYYLAYAMCAHLVAASRIFERELPSIKSNRGYIYRSKRGPKQKTNPMAQYLLSEPIHQDVSTDITGPDTATNPRKRKADEDLIDMVETAAPVRSSPTTAPPAKRGRGRPPLSEAEKAARKNDECLTDMVEAAAPVTSSSSTAPPVKRGRGRPRLVEKAVRKADEKNLIENKCGRRAKATKALSIN